MPCIICTDRFDSVLDIAQTKCGHVFHYDCISKWVEQSKTCPECRCVVFSLVDLRINFTPSDDTPRLRFEMCKVKTLLEEKEIALLTSNEQIEELQLQRIFKNADDSKVQEHLKGLELKHASIRAKVGLRSLPSLVTKVQRLKKEKKRLTEEFNSIKTTSSSQKDEVPPMKKRRGELKLNKEVKEKSASSVKRSKLSTSSVKRSKLSTSSVNSSAAKEASEPAATCNHQKGKCSCSPRTISEK
ncbi:hypothetical protein TNCV_4059411 [Trichonephila clavipes]|nr:hypothetical protein TNCV_4059411 [Trichonephila clavipes]